MRLGIRACCVVPFVLGCCAALLRADDKPALPEDVLKTKGLTRVNTQYLVDGDVKLPEALKSVRGAKKQEEDYKTKRTAIERQLKAARANVTEWGREHDRIQAEMNATGKGDTRKYNRLVGQVNALENRIRESDHLVIEKLRELASLIDPHNRYVTTVVALSDQMEAAAKRYEELGADPEVKATLAKLNEKPGPKFRLGPSSQFAEELPKTRKLRDQIISSPVKLTFDGGTPQVQVTLNGKATQWMTFDSGAASVMLSWNTAEQAGVTPGPGDPTVIMEVANGKKVEAKRIVLETVQVGPFVARNVECSVLPKSAGEVGGLLGGTFLRHFAYKVDLAAGELHMTQLVDPGGKTVATTQIGADAALARSTAKGNGYPIPASGNWTPVAFTVEAGKCYRVKSRGSWKGSVGPFTGPEGFCPPEIFHVLGPQPYLAEQQKDRYLGQHPRNALVGRVGSEQWDFYVGSECSFLAPVSGQLSFKMNDTASASPERSGKLEVTVEAVTPQWVDRNGKVEVLARVDADDLLHLTPAGMYWEWGGSWGKVGLHEGYWPTVVNGIYWWPRWSDPKKTDPLVASDLWPKTLSKFQMEKVQAKRGSVTVVSKSDAEIVLKFHDDGLGSTQVGCLLSTGNLVNPPAREGSAPERQTAPKAAPKPRAR